MLRSMESCRSSQVRYLKTCQEEEEKVSAYVLQVEPLLRRVVEKRAIPRNIANQVHLEQVMARASLSRVLWCRLGVEEPGMATQLPGVDEGDTGRRGGRGLL